MKGKKKSVKDRKGSLAQAAKAMPKTPAGKLDMPACSNSKYAKKPNCKM